MPPPLLSEQTCKDETIRIHDVFVDWLNGTVENSDEFFDKQVGAVLASDLVLVQTNGNVLYCEILRNQLRHAHGTKKGLFFNMEIHEFQLLQAEEDTGLCMYQEWHYGVKSDKEKEQREAKSLLNEKRQCTVMFRRNPNAPCGVEWVHIHETTITMASE